MCTLLLFLLQWQNGNRIMIWEDGNALICIFFWRFSLHLDGNLSTATESFKCNFLSCTTDKIPFSSILKRRLQKSQSDDPKNGKIKLKENLFWGYLQSIFRVNRPCYIPTTMTQQYVEVTQIPFFFEGASH